ncbi:hypothetical protein WMY93_022889 [Mugilogobius chulae]|uniref:Neurotensin/neuromedin N n=1 Tax=Mugilogobius chulae TaxID=88201 RepID=A0AAW0N5W8_9GOBI
MQVQWVCVLVLCFTCGSICSELDSDQRALTQDLLSGLLNAKMRQSQQSAPFWRMSLSALCRLVMDDEGWSQERADQEVEQEEAELSEPGPAPLSQDLYSLRLLCRVLQNRQNRLQMESENLVEENPEVPLKRKSPFILKRQTSHGSKSRRPYILKRSAIY